MPIELYISPFALSSPFHFTVFLGDPHAKNYKPPPSSQSVATRINDLVRELGNVPETGIAPFSATSDFRSAPKADKWMLFSIERLTLVSMSSATALLEAKGTASSYGGGKYIVLPTNLAFAPGVLAGIQSFLPSMIPYVSIHNARNTLQNPCRECKCAGRTVCIPPYHEAKSKFHANGLDKPWTSWGRASKSASDCHLGIWIPGISLPWELVVSVSASFEISSMITNLFTNALHEWKSENEGKSPLIATLGYYPSSPNWMLVDCATGMLIHNISVRDMKFSPESTHTYIVIPIQCGELSKSMLDALRKDGATGWEDFWIALLATASDDQSSINSPFETAPSSVVSSD